MATYSNNFGKGAIQGLGQGLIDVGKMTYANDLEMERQKRLEELRSGNDRELLQTKIDADVDLQEKRLGADAEENQKNRDHNLAMEKTKAAAKHAPKGWEAVTVTNADGSQSILRMNKDTGEYFDKNDNGVLPSLEQATQLAEEEYSREASMWQRDEAQFGVSEGEFINLRAEEISKGLPRFSLITKAKGYKDIWGKGDKEGKGAEPAANKPPVTDKVDNGLLNDVADKAPPAAAPASPATTSAPKTSFDDNYTGNQQRKMQALKYASSIKDKIMRGNANQITIDEINIALQDPEFMNNLSELERRAVVRILQQNNK